MVYAMLLLGFLPFVLWADDDPADADDALDTDNFPASGEFVIEPVHMDDAAAGEELSADTDVLMPVGGDDEPTGEPTNVGHGAILPLNDIGPDAFWVDFDETAGVNVAEIIGFDRDEDVLDVVIDPDSVKGKLNVSFRPSQGSDDVSLYIENELVAVFRDTGRLDAENVNVIVAML